MALQRPPVMIIGAHRSGTTATARALELCGLQIGQRLDSHRESKALQRLHEEYLERIGASWHRPRPFLQWVETPKGEHDCLEYLRQRLADDSGQIFGYENGPTGLYFRMRRRFGAPWGWKEPRTTLFARVWLRFFPNAHVIHVIRHPLAVAMSIREREMKFRAAGDRPIPQLQDLEYCLGLALTYVELAECVADRTRYYRRIRFEEFQRNPRETLNELARFCGLHPRQSRLTKSAGTIRQENARQRNDVPQQQARELLNAYPVIAKLGYDWP